MDQIPQMLQNGPKSLPNALKWIKFSKMDQMLHPNGIKCSQMKFHTTLILQYLAEFIYHNNIILWKLTLDTLHSYLCTYLGTYLPTSLDDVSLTSDIFWKFTHPFIGMALPVCVIRRERLLWDNEGIVY